MHQRLTIALCFAALTGLPAGMQQYDDPPLRVGRLSAINGNVSLLPAGVDDWIDADLNYPITVGDAVWADLNARSEIHLESSVIRQSSETSVTFDALDDQVTQLRVARGSIEITVQYLDRTANYEIDTPVGVILLDDVGTYRIDVTPDGRRATLTVRSGSGELSDGPNPFEVRPGTSATLTGSSTRPYASSQAIPIDAWEDWCLGRDRREATVASSQYVSRDMLGYEDLQQYGTWQNDASYGPIWYPTNVRAEWAPYREGHWASIAPWGWTWIDDAPWGFAPFHYGRWAQRGGRWGWVPGTVRAHPVYAPALVAFISGDQWGVSLRFGSAGGVGWIALAPNEPFIPAYHASPTYLRDVNSPNTRGGRYDAGRTSVSQLTYANRGVIGGVTAVSRDAFEHSRPIGRAAVTVSPRDLARARASAEPIAGGQAVPDQRRDARVAQPRPAAQTVQRPNAAPIVLPRVDPRSANPRPGRGRPDRGTPPTPPPAPITQTPPITAEPPGRGRGRPDRGSPPPVVPTPPPVVPTPPPAPIPAQPPGRGGGRPDRAGVTPPQVQPGSPPANSAATAQQLKAWEDESAALSGRQKQQVVDLKRKHQLELQSASRGVIRRPIGDVIKQQQLEEKALADRQQKERETLDQRKPVVH